MAEVPESERSTAQVLETPVDCLGRSVAGAGAVEEREDVRSALLQGPAQSADLDQRGRNAASDGVDHGLHHLLALDLVGFSVGGDDALVDAPGRFDLYAVVVGEQRLQTVALLVGEEAVTGVQGAADLVERIPGTAPMPLDICSLNFSRPSEHVLRRPNCGPATTANAYLSEYVLALASFRIASSVSSG